MHKWLFSGLSLVLINFVTAESSFSQLPEQQIKPETGINGEQPDTEAIRQVSKVEVKNNLLSVELVNAEFGSVMNYIAQKSELKVDISSDVSGRRLTTKFSDIDLERGIIRLLALIKEKNYLIHYDTKGMLSKIEIYGGTPAVPAASKTQAPIRPQFQRSAPADVPPVTQGRPVPQRPTVSRTAPVQQPDQPLYQPQVPQNNMEDNGGDIVEEVPYIPPQKKPVYIPPRVRQ